MKTTGYRPISVPIKLHLDFDQMTVGELSNILRQWQALLRSAWRESYELVYSPRVPTVRLLTVSASTENSFDLLSDFAIPAVLYTTAVAGPILEWPSVARTAYYYLASIWEPKGERYQADDSRHIVIIGGDTPAMRLPVAALGDTEVGERVENLWSTANSGEINITVELPEDPPRET